MLRCFTLSLFSFFVAVCAATLSAQEVSTPPDPFAGATALDRAALLAAVLERNPRLEAARQALAATRQRPAQVSALENLMVSYSLAPRSLGSDVPFGREIELSQPVPYPGKRRLRGEAGAAEAEIAGADLESLRIDLARRVSQLFDDDYVLHRALEINVEHSALLEDFKSVATARYAAGLASQQDPLEGEAELAHLLHDGVLLRSQLAVVEADLNALLHRPPAAALPPPPKALAAEASAHENGGELVSRALAQRPELRRNAAMRRQRQSELALAKLEGRPDFSVMAAYNSMWSDVERRFMIGAAVGLPIWRSRVGAAIAEAQARAAQVESEGAALEDDVRREVAQADTRRREAQHILEIFRSRLLPVASDRVEAALAGFKSGRNDFLALVTAERGLRSVKLEYHEALANLYRRRADLAAALGETLWPDGSSTASGEGVVP